ncbi:MAG: type IV pili methyl-accepting chemotaxis transducer N-terminal domain-containing protein [Burkholderiaceae bacterium]
MKRRSLLLFIVPSIALSIHGIAAAQVRDINDAINKAGRQRMLSQRVAKAYLALGQAVRKDHAERVLGESMALFDRQLFELKAFSPKPEIKATYEQLETAWSAYKGVLVGAAASKPGAESVVTSANQVLALANQGTVQLESLSGKPVGKLVNIAGRQRMLSQRMAVMYLAASWGVQADTAVKEMNTARDEFVRAQAVLEAAPESSAAIKAELELAEQQYSFFDTALRTLRPGSANPTLLGDVFTTSERILQVMDGVTGMYARLTG